MANFEREVLTEAARGRAAGEFAWGVSTEGSANTCHVKAVWRSVRKTSENLKDREPVFDARNEVGTNFRPWEAIGSGVRVADLGGWSHALFASYQGLRHYAGRYSRVDFVANADNP